MFDKTDQKFVALVCFQPVTAKYRKIFLCKVMFYNFISMSLRQIENYVMYLTGNL